MALDPKSTEFKLKEVVVGFLLKHPFFGKLISDMEWHKTDDIPTLATDGASIYYNEEYFISLTPAQRKFAIAHELLHCVLQTFTRLGSRNMSYWNMATDYANNAILVDEKIGELKLGSDGKPEWLYDQKYNGMIAEQIYEILMKEKPPIKMPMDVHMYGGKPRENGDDKKDNKVAGDKKGKELSISQKELEDNMRKFKDKVIEAYQIAKMAGKMPGSLQTIIDDLLNPKINWKTLLNVSIQSLLATDRNFSRINRRSIDPGIILPNMFYDDTVDICVAVDTSGSISDKNKKEFLSEIVGILKYYPKFDLKIWCFDTRVTGFKEYDFNNIEDVENFEFTGGGGTDIRCNFEFMKQNNIIPKQFICFTDAYNCNNDWGPNNYCPTTWIIFDNKKPQIPFGQWTLYEPEVQ